MFKKKNKAEPLPAGITGMSVPEQEKTPNKKSKASKKKKDKSIHLPQTVSESIPYKYIYSNGIIEIENGKFSKSYKIPDVNFKTATDDAQWTLAEQYSEFICTFDADTEIEITLYNKTIDAEDFQKKVFIPMRSDSLNGYREEFNHMLAQKMEGAKNNLETNKYLTVTIKAKSIDLAIEKFSQIDRTVEESLSLMTKTGATAMTMIERLELLNSIYNGDEAKSLTETRVIDGHQVAAFSLENCIRQGITTKDVIGPSSMEFKRDGGMIGDSLIRSYIVTEYPTWIRGTILTDFASIPTNMLVSVYFKPLDQGKSIKEVKRQGVNISSLIIDAQKKASRSGYSADLISPDLQDAKEETNSIMNKITRENVRLFTTTFVFTLFADNEEDMKRCEEQLKLIATKNLLSISRADNQQEFALATALPLGNKKLMNERFMTSQSIASIIPFDVKEVRQENGMYYGLNAVSKNMILYNRSLDKINPCGCILGMPGAGKSFAAKREIIDVLLSTDDEVYVIDPEREYTTLAKSMNGEVIKIANGSNVYINPMDMNLNNHDDSGDPVKIKADFMETIVEIMVGGRYGLQPQEKSIINRSVINVYEPYIRHLKRTGLNQDFEHAPTLVDLYNDLCQQPQLEAQNIALSLERYVRGGLDIFSHRTNVSTTSRFMVYDIKDIGEGLKELGLQIALDNIWNKMIENSLSKKRTWIYIDEFYLMMQKPSSAEYISQIWKRARKWAGVPCALTQNVEDMLKSDKARDVINNSSFILMLGQSAINKQQLTQLFGISPTEQKYISSAKPGMGLIRINDNLIPVDDSFPTDTKLYKLMSTKPDEKLIL